MARGWGEHAFLTNYGQPLGAIGDVLEQLGAEWGIPIPPLNALVLNAKLGVPGPGCDWYIRQYSGRNYGQLGLTNKHKIVADIHRDMEDFAFWEEVLHGLGLEPLPSPQRPTAAYGFGGGESDEHRRLKEFVAANPAVVASSGSWRGQTEYPFRSGDAVDVMLISADACIAVEVKSAEASVAEQVRGVFQCVKYRALLRAEQTLAGRDPIGEAVLVVGGSLGPEARQIGRNLGVRVMEHVVVRPSGDR